MSSAPTSWLLKPCICASAALRRVANRKLNDEENFMSGRLKMAVVSMALMVASITAAFAISPEEARSIALVAVQGNEGAQVLMAGIYLRGDGGYATDPVLAAQWFERAAAQGNSYAQ